jgi:parallel beta-helix repeat protein
VHKQFLSLSIVNLLVATTVGAAPFVVTKNADSGPGTLRQAILDANANPGPDEITFNIPGSGVQTIALLSVLPDIIDSVEINGYSQPGSSANTLANADNAVILVRLDGVNLTNSQPIAVNFVDPGASGSSLRGLVIVRFSKGIQIDEASNITITGNWIGMDVDGIARGTTFEGIYVTSFFNPAYNIIIGSGAPADRNIISGNRYGVYMSGNTTGNSSVQGNFIGTDPTGTLPRGNLFGGVYLFSCTNVTVGGASAAARNILSSATGAGGTGVTMQGGGGHLIQGNLIGTDISGQYDLGNFSDGIYVTSSKSNRMTGNQVVNNRGNGINLNSSSGTIVENNSIGTDGSATRPLGNTLAGVNITGSTNRIGGLTFGQGNRIQFNGGAGVDISSAFAIQNEISGNSIYDNGGLGINLNPAGINANDFQDADVGANGGQNYPVLTNAVFASGALTVQGVFNSSPSSTHRLEFFATPAWDSMNIPEGKVFVGTTNVTTDGNGDALFDASFAAPPTAGWLITATATDSNGNTSEFSAGMGISISQITNPLLSIASTNSGGQQLITVSWPSAASGFGLQRTDTLQPPVAWQSVTSGIVDWNGISAFTITNSGTTNAFFRVKKP